MGRQRWAAIAIAVLCALWELAIKPIWNLNVERWAEQRGLDTELRDVSEPVTIWDAAMDVLVPLLELITGPYAIGFVVGALIFAFWDPMVRLVRSRTSGKRLEAEPASAGNDAADLPLAGGLFETPQQEVKYIESPNFTKRVYEGSHRDLMLFVNNHLIPLCSLHFEIQEKLVEYCCYTEEIRRFALDGLRENSRMRVLIDAFNELHRLWDSPPEYIPLNRMIECVDAVERNYKSLVRQTSMLAAEANIKLQDDEILSPKWRACLKGHQDLITAYNQIKLDSALGRLFRPGRQSRWHDAGLPEG